MGFWIVYSLIAVLCIILTGLPLVGYCDCVEWIKVAVYVFLFIAWFSPILIWNWQSNKAIPLKLYNIAAKIGYFLEGFAFLLMAVLLLRDIVWWGTYLLSSGWLIVSPLSGNVLAIANILTVVGVFLVSLLGVYMAEKQPKVVHYTFKDKRIKTPLKALVISDTHINKTISINKVKAWVSYFNTLTVDMIFLPGDIADDDPADVQKQLKELGKLKAKQGIYFVLGNHETYFNPVTWEAEFSTLGWRVLHNSGVSLEKYGIYVAGVPDGSAFYPNISQSIKNAAADEYRILLSHNPTIAKLIGNNKVDLLISGHTHGGQIFPFNWLAKLGNMGLVAGLYEVGNTKVLVSRGAGYWGPPMRIGAPNDVLLIELLPEKQNY